ncbi:hypothetical protein EFD56_23030 [Rhizobium phaseoli]|nr:hypothetical protein EFD56_23030 [Rhizobium phaseoli]
MRFESMLTMRGVIEVCRRQQLQIAIDNTSGRTLNAAGRIAFDPAAIVIPRCKRTGHGAEDEEM